MANVTKRRRTVARIAVGGPFMVFTPEGIR
jgi:hypothetical protein